MNRYRLGEALKGLLEACVLIATTSLIEGFVVKTLWLWFMVPTFRLPSLTYGTSIGIAALLAYVVGNFEGTGGEKPWWEVLGIVLLKAVLILGVGWFARELPL